MEIAEGYDLVANEWTSGFERCLEGARTIIEFMQALKFGNQKPDFELLKHRYKRSYRVYFFEIAFPT